MRKIAGLLLLTTMAVAGCNGTPGTTGPSLIEVKAVSSTGRTGVASTRNAGAALSLTSSERGQHGLPAVTNDGRLMRAAQAHATFMAVNGIMGHVGSGGSTMSQRVKASGYTACFAAENVAYGQSTAEEVMQAWMNSPGHRRNILDGRARDAAVASAIDGAGRVYWAMLLAKRC